MGDSINGSWSVFLEQISYPAGGITTINNTCEV